MKTFKNLIFTIIITMMCYGMQAQNNSVKLEPNSPTGQRGVFIGNSAGSSVTSEYDNTYIGDKAGLSSTGYRNTYIGSKAGVNSTSGVYNTFLGYLAGSASVGSNNVFLGAQAGTANTSGGFNVLVGSSAGKSLTTKEGNTFIGAFAGEFSNNDSNTFIGHASGRYTIGGRNTYVGQWTGRDMVSGEENVLMGTWVGVLMTSGNKNTMLGTCAGQNKTSGDANVYLGYRSGYINNGNRNVFIGNQSGSQVAGDDQLYIENSDTITAPLIYGDFANDKVGINTNDVPEGYTLAVRGDIIAEEIRLKLYADGWPDYVFKSDYQLRTLEETEQEIKVLGHLPGVPSAEEVGEDGVEIGEMNTILLEKIEELTLHLIDINKTVKQLHEENKQLRNRIIKLEK